MYSIDDFQATQADDLKSIELPLEGMPEEWQALDISRATFRYVRDWSPRIFLEVEGQEKSLSMPDGDISLGASFPDQKFIRISTKFRSFGSGLITLSPKVEPFMFGDKIRATHAKCIVLNGPSTHFEGQALSWEAEGLNFQYSLFSGIWETLRDKEKMPLASIPTGVLTVSFGGESSFDGVDLWKIFYRASTVLTFASGGRVGVGHVEMCGEEGERYWMLGFSSRDRFPHENNWFDIEIVRDFPCFASAYYEFLKVEPLPFPLLNSSDFYRASNSIRKSSAAISLVASYSALEILTHHILRKDANWTKDLLSRAKFEDKLRAAAAFVGLDADPLEHATRLKNFLQSHNNLDGFSALAKTRNSIVHSDKSFRVDGFELLELWSMSQWLVEIFTFYLIGYKGLMADRRRLTGWRGEGTHKVPIKNNRISGS
jgi:hypothetical protein